MLNETIDRLPGGGTVRHGSTISYLMSVNPTTLARILVNLNTVSKIEVGEKFVVFSDTMNNKIKIPLAGKDTTTILTNEEELWQAIYGLGMPKAEIEGEPQIETVR